MRVTGSSNLIGGTVVADRNVISGNGIGVYLSGALATGNVLIGNDIGTDRAGNIILGDEAEKIEGVAVDGASGNMIGEPTDMPGTVAGNIIAGYQTGIFLFIEGCASRFTKTPRFRPKFWPKV